MNNTRRLVRFALPLVSLLLLVACASGGDEETDSSDTATPVTTADSSTSSSVPSPATGSIIGSWTADAGEILGANTVNVGGTGGMTCTGPIVMTFSPDGSFDRSGDVLCGVGGSSFGGTIATVGQWEQVGSSLNFSGTTTTGTMTIGGAVTSMADSFGDGAAEFSIVDDTLTITFTIDPVGTVIQIYTRV